MKLSQDAIAILKHATQLSSGIKIDAGNEILSAHDSGAVRMYAELSESDRFPQSFALINLTQFLNTLSLLEEPELEFDEYCVNISSDDMGTKIQYYYSDPELVNQDNKKLKANLEYEVNTVISYDVIAHLFKAANTIGADDICLYNNGRNVYIAALDKRKQNGNRYDHIVSELPDDVGKFKVYFRKSNLKLTGNDFSVKVSSRGLSIWEATNATVPVLRFYVAVEKDSEFS